MIALPKPVRLLPAQRRRIAQHSSRERAKLIATADRLARQLTLTRAGNRCELCGKRGQLDAAHGLGKKAHPSVRFHGANLFAACRDCHARGHADPVWWNAQRLRILGPVAYADVTAASFRALGDLRSIVAGLKRGEWLAGDRA